MAVPRGIMLGNCGRPDDALTQPSVQSSDPVATNNPRERVAAVKVVISAGSVFWLLAALPSGLDAAETGAPTLPEQRAPPAAAPAAAAPALAPRTEPRFNVTRYTFEGATLLSTDQLDAAVAALTGEGRTFADIEEAIQQVKAAYDAAGITAVQVLVPEQALDSGIVRLEITEAKIVEVEIQGAKLRSEDNIRRAVPSVREGLTPVDTVISRELRLANENPGRQMQTTFSPDAEGRLKAVMRVADRDSVAGAATLENTGNAGSGQWRVGALLQHMNLFDRDVVGTLQLQTSPGHVSDVKIAVLNLRAPLYDAGLLLEATALHSSVDSGQVQTSAGSYLLSSSGTTFGLRATRLLPRWDQWEPRISLGYDNKKVTSDVKLKSDGASVVPEIVLRPVTLTYSGTWRDEAFSVFGALGVSHNLPGSGRSAAAVFAEPGLRAGANPRYTVWRPAVSATLPWQGGSIEAQWSAQFTPDALVPAEQFGLGGEGSVRGFNGRVASGDKGQRVSLEYQSAPQPWAESWGLAGGWQVFTEAGRVERNHPQPGEVVRTTLAAIGGGVRLSSAQGLSLRLDLGVVAKGAGLARQGDHYGHLSLNQSF